MLSADLHPMFAVAVPYINRVPAADASHRFHPTAVAAAVAVAVDALVASVADSCGELAGANIALTRDWNGPSNALSLLGDAVANETQRAPGRVTAAAPVTQSSIAFCR